MFLDLSPHEVVDAQNALVRLRGREKSLQGGKEGRHGKGRSGEALKHDVQNLHGLPRPRVEPRRVFVVLNTANFESTKSPTN